MAVFNQSQAPSLGRSDGDGDCGSLSDDAAGRVSSPEVLEGAGLIARRIEGTKRPCRLDPEAIEEIDRWLGMLRQALAQNYDRLDGVFRANERGCGCQGRGGVRGITRSARRNTSAGAPAKAALNKNKKRRKTGDTPRRRPKGLGLDRPGGRRPLLLFKLNCCRNRANRRLLGRQVARF